MDPFLLDKNFAWNPLLAYGSTTQRANGFFLLEPSMFSQMLCLAILIDLFVVGRWRYLPLYTIAYMVSYSGTGLLTLALTLALVGMTSIRYSTRVVGLALIAIFTAGLAAAVLPGEFAIFTHRFGELNTTQSSGYHRYLAPMAQVSEFSNSLRMLIGYGPGATTRSTYYADGTGNPAVQIFMDYGLVGVISFFIFLISSIASRRYAAVGLLLVLIFELGGGYFLFVPNMLLVALLGVWMASGPDDAPLASPVAVWRRRHLPLDASSR